MKGSEIVTNQCCLGVLNQPWSVWEFKFTLFHAAITCWCPLFLQSSLAETLDSSGSLDAQRTDMIYTIEDVPPWYLCIFLGLQVHPRTEMVFSSKLVEDFLSSSLCLCV